ncbi:lamin-like protein [Neltuma alba]|uniref:lamin-like protein n=1 Tax=Neltuma alba TaxID=207710 RepID=UPI0010A470CD|nr:lamin-like protein [Prosopis alba]
MEMKRKTTLFLMIAMAMGFFCTESRDPVLHRVGGGRYTWRPKVNFTEWASHDHFYKGDWLYFGFDKQLYTVLEVNKTSYENCIDRDFIMNITRGGRDVFQLLEEKPYYFISGKGFCLEGMKVAINVEEFPPEKPGFLMTSRAFSFHRESHVMFSLLLASAWVFT